MGISSWPRPYDRGDREEDSNAEQGTTSVDFGDLRTDIALRFPEREGLVCKEQRYSFAALEKRIDETAKGFIAIGVSSGDHVSLWLNNCPEWIITLFALAKIGAVHIPVNTRFRTRDLDLRSAPIRQRHADYPMMFRVRWIISV